MVVDRQRGIRAGSAVAMALVAVVVAGCAGATATAEPGATQTATQHSAVATAQPTAAATAPALVHEHISSAEVGGGTGISFDHPAQWASVPFLFLRNYTNGDPSALYPTCCHLQPNTFAASLTTSSAVPVDMAQFAPGSSASGWDVRTVGDWLVAWQTMATQPSDLVDVHLYWMIGRPGPGKTIYKISAIFRGPDLAPMEAPVEAFVDSIVLDPEPTPNPS
jgi:hypothetical protein